MLGRLASGAEHGVEVTEALGPAPHVVEHQIDERLVHPAAVGELGRRDPDAFLIDLVDPARQRARSHAADVVPVTPRGGEHGNFALEEHRVEQQYVVEVRAAGVGVVVQEQIALVDVAGERLDHLAGRVRHGEDMDRVVGQALRHLAAVARHQGTGEIVALVDDRRVGRMDDVGAHLVDHGDQRFANQLELDKFVHAFPRRRATVSPCFAPGQPDYADEAQQMR